MMMEHLDPRESGREELAAPRAQSQDPMIDREVPLESATMSSALCRPQASLNCNSISRIESSSVFVMTDLWRIQFLSRTRDYLQMTGLCIYAKYVGTQ